MIDVSGLILSAGESRRMGSQNKALAILCGQTLVERVMDRLAPQVDRIIISGDRQLLGHLPYDIIEDETGPHRGPLMGLHSVFQSSLVQSEHLMMVACDGVFFPTNLVAKLHALVLENNADIGCIRYRGFPQPMFSLWNKRTAPSIACAVLEKRLGGFKLLLASLRSVYLDWPENSINPFFNINTPKDLRYAETILCP